MSQSAHRCHFPSGSLVQDPASWSSPLSPYRFTSSTGTPRSRDRGSDISQVNRQVSKLLTQQPQTRPSRVAWVMSACSCGGSALGSRI